MQPQKPPWCQNQVLRRTVWLCDYATEVKIKNRIFWTWLFHHSTAGWLNSCSHCVYTVLSIPVLMHVNIKSQFHEPEKPIAQFNQTHFCCLQNCRRRWETVANIPQIPTAGSYQRQLVLSQVTYQQSNLLIWTNYNKFSRIKLQDGHVHCLVFCGGSLIVRCRSAYLK